MLKSCLWEESAQFVAWLAFVTDRKRDMKGERSRKSESIILRSIEHMHVDFFLFTQLPRPVTLCGGT